MDQSQASVHREVSSQNSYLSLDQIQDLFNQQEEHSYSKWALRTTRNWTNIQLIAVKAAISILLANTIWSEVRSLDQDTQFNWPRYLLIAFLVVILYFVYRFENINNKIEDEREERKERIEKSQIAQMLSIQYIFNNLLPNADSQDKQINILKIIPQMMALIDADQVTKEVSTGFQLIADVTTNVLSKIDRVHEDVREAINLDKLVAAISDVPRPRRRNAAPDDLIPKDDLFPE